MAEFVDLTLKRFGHWTVIERAGITERHAILWRCLCDCGQFRLILGFTLRSGASRSCGCQSNVTHGHARPGKLSREFQCWVSMRSRCRNQSNPGFKRYGGRGISVCQRWESSFENFLADMGPSPGARYSLDRIDNDGDYEPGNCRWTTGKEQVRHLRKISEDDLDKVFERYSEGMTQTQIAEVFGVSQGHVSAILNGKKRK